MSITVEVRHGNVEKAKKILKAGILKEYREKQYYRKPSFIKREKKKEGIKNWKKKQKLIQDRL